MPDLNLLRHVICHVNVALIVLNAVDEMPSTLDETALWQEWPRDALQAASHSAAVPLGVLVCGARRGFCALVSVARQGDLVAVVARHLATKPPRDASPSWWPPLE